MSISQQSSVNTRAAQTYFVTFHEEFSGPAENDHSYTTIVTAECPEQARLAALRSIRKRHPSLHRRFWCWSIRSRYWNNDALINRTRNDMPRLGSISFWPKRVLSLRAV